jgi:hypothetical protein
MREFAHRWRAWHEKESIVCLCEESLQPAECLHVEPNQPRSRILYALAQWTQL